MVLESHCIGEGFTVSFGAPREGFEDDLAVVTSQLIILLIVVAREGNGPIKPVLIITEYVIVGKV